MEFWTAGGHGTNGVEQHTGCFPRELVTAGFSPGRTARDFCADNSSTQWMRYPCSWYFSPPIRRTARPGPIRADLEFPYARARRALREIAGGALFTNTQVPQGTSRINFTSAGGVGVHISEGK